MKNGTVQKAILKGIEAAVFDFDGTLAVLNIDFPAMRGAVLKLAEGFGIPPGIFDGLFVLETIEAGRSCMAADSAASAERFHREAMDLVSGIELCAARNGSLFDGVRDMLSQMEKRKIRRGIITRNCGAAVSLIFPDICDYCEVFLPRETAGRVKPHPGHILETLARMDVSPARAVMVGDHPMDIRAGRNSGTRTAGVLTGSSGREDLLRAGADIIVPSAPDILPLLA